MSGLEQRVLNLIRLYNTPECAKERVRDDARRLASLCRKQQRPDLSDLLLSETEAPPKTDEKPTAYYREKARRWIAVEKQSFEPSGAPPVGGTKYTCRNAQRFKKKTST